MGRCINGQWGVDEMGNCINGIWGVGIMGRCWNGWWELLVASLKLLVTSTQNSELKTRH